MKVPYERSKLAVLGVGGDMGSVLYGYMQRASSLYGYGIESRFGCPKAFSATNRGTANLNSVLSRCFKLAFAGEDKCALTDFENVDAMSSRLKPFDYIITATAFRMAETTVTSGTYEVKPGQRTKELFLDGSVGDEDKTGKESLAFTKRLIEACAGQKKHLVIINNDRSTSGKENSQLHLDTLLASDLPFTFVNPLSSSLTKTRDFTFDAVGLQSALEARGVDPSVPLEATDGPPMAEEDLAAFTMACIHLLDSSKSRVINVRSTAATIPMEESGTLTSPGKSDKQWVVGQQYLYSMLEKNGLNE